MKEREFAVKKHREWEQLESIVSRAHSKSGLKSLARDEILALGPLYRRASSDLSRAQSHDASPDLIAHLNSLVGRAHALLYEADTSARPLYSILDFYIYEFPSVLQRRWKAFLAAFAITMFGGLLAYSLVLHDSNNVDLFIPANFKSSVEAWKSKKVTEGPALNQSGFLMTNNMRVGLLASSLGILIVPDCMLMLDNGGTVGALSAIMTQVHGHSTFWPGILPHGIAELTAIFICGGAGFVLGIALLVPGRYTRPDALKLAGADAFKMVLGTVPMFIFAGMIEGMFSHQGTAPWFRYTFAGLNGIAWYLYLFLPRQRPGAASR